MMIGPSSVRTVPLVSVKKSDIVMFDAPWKVIWVGSRELALTVSLKLRINCPRLASKLNDSK